MIELPIFPFYMIKQKLVKYAIIDKQNKHKNCKT